MKIHNLGFPRIGKHRELKFALEKFWQNKITEEQFLNSAQRLRQQHWQLQADAGLDLLPAGDFVHYDHILTASLALGVIPKRFGAISDKLALEFAIARGSDNACHSCAASDMTKWFDTNYHYLVPELNETIDYVVDPSHYLEQIAEAQRLGKEIKPVIVGPLTYLYLSEYQGQDKLACLPGLLEAYQELISAIQSAGCQWLQIDEPILVLELDKQWRQAFIDSYQSLSLSQSKILLATYFGSVSHQLDVIAKLPLDGIHLDTVTVPFDWQTVIAQLPEHWVISLGVIDGRNIWKTDLVSVYQKLQPIYRQLNQRLWLAPSCSLLHVPYDVTLEQSLDPEIKSWLAFAQQKCDELVLLKQALLSECSEQITRYSAQVLKRLVSTKGNNPEVAKAIEQLAGQDGYRSQGFTERKNIQQQTLKLPLFPTTTIGSFPQTSNIRTLRAQLKKGLLDQQDYQRQIKEEIANVIAQQEKIGLDVLVHGEPERNDMVEYFGELLDGCAITEYAWVQSYGSRCVKPPIIYGDVSRSHNMTIEWIKYAQSLTKKPVKAMLTGPVTILSWSFIRDDIARERVALQLALAIQAEVDVLVAENIGIIQIDEPAIKEAMPLKASQWPAYCQWATKAFRLCSVNVPAATQIHSHMCYSEFNEILPAIIALDADVLTIETSRSNMALLNSFEQQDYPNDLGPGVYDIHSPNVPEIDWIKQLLNKAQHSIPAERLWVNPDCGLKTRSWSETEPALINMVSAAKALRVESTSKQLPEFESV
ncbi:5-methyltetrahydropteroyltriglutamate--homocysteine S-methyltransferase [Colwellia sp. MEBiC06753]